MSFDSSPPALSLDLEDLERLLNDCPDEDNAMVLGELDGYLAGTLISPHPVPQEQCLCEIWGGAEQPFPDDPPRSARLIGYILARKAQIAAELLVGNLAYRPAYEIDPVNGEILWEIWVEGFMRAMALSGKNWDPLADTGDEDLGAAFLGLLIFVAMVHEGRIDDIEAASDAAELLPYFVETIYRRQHGLERVVLDYGFDDDFDDFDSREPIRVTKVGRNAPCPCGSGKKFKKCCGAG